MQYSAGDYCAAHTLVHFGGDDDMLRFRACAIADRLKTSETAVKASLQQPFAKTGIRTRRQLGPRRLEP